MQLDFYSLFCYITALFVSFYLADGYEKSPLGGLKRKLYLLSVFLFVLFFCSFRFFVGNDYDGYVKGFYLIQQYGSNVMLWEPGYYWLNDLFSTHAVGYWYVFFISSFISCFFLFIALCKENVLKWGLFFTFTLGLLIFMNNGIRQGIAITVFLYAIRYVQERSFIKYLLCVLLATCFHYSALILIFVYFIREVRLPGYLWVLLLLMTFALQFTGVFRTLLNQFIAHIPYYGSGYSTKGDVYVSADTLGLGILYKFLVALTVAVFYKRLDSPFYATLFLMGAVLNNLFFGMALFERISNYLLFTNVIVFAHLVNRPFLRQVKYVLVSVSLLYYGIQSLTGMERDGAVPYRTIINEDLENPDYEKYED